VKRKRNTLAICLISITMLLCKSNFAYTYSLDISNGFTLDPWLSDQMFATAQQNFPAMKFQMESILPSLELSQQEMVMEYLIYTEIFLNTIDRIGVYRTTENIPGDAFDSLYSYYQVRIPLQYHANEQAGGRLIFPFPSPCNNDTLNFLFDMPGLLPPQTRDTLMPLILDGKVEVAIGLAEDCAMSLSSIYLHPETFEAIHGTTLTVITGKGDFPIPPNSVPIPSSLFLLGIGWAGLAAIRRKT